MDNDLKIFVLNGPSASGKTSIMEGLLEKRNDLERLVTVTTRAMRPGEVDGKDYYFLTPEAFQEAKDRGEVVEETVYAGTQYGIFSSEIERIRQNGRFALTVLDMHGVEEMQRFYGKCHVISVFIYRPQRYIEAELKKRPVSKEETDKRIEKAKKEFHNMEKCNHILTNTGSLDDAVKKMEAIVDAEEKKTQILGA